MTADLDRLGAEKYVLLTTFRKDGSAVPTPVWVARDGDELVMYSAPDAGKVKRIRRDGTVRIAPCTVGGKPTGPEVTGQARLLDEPGIRATQALLARKYGITYRLVTLGGIFRKTLPAGIAVKLD